MIKEVQERNNYKIIIYWSDEDNAFLAEAPELPACMVDGKTRGEAVHNAEQIIAEWLETAEILNRPVPIKAQFAYLNDFKPNSIL
jgi:predicted RNase H-like HicB family nuclease